MIPDVLNLAIRDGLTVIESADGSYPLSVGDTLFEMQCVCADAGEGIVALEDDEQLIILRAGMQTAKLPKPDWSVFDAYPDDWTPSELERITEAAEDLLGETVLASGEPELEDVRAQMPALKGYAFLAHPAVAQPVMVERDGQIERFCETPLAESGEDCEMAASAVFPPVIWHSCASREQLSFMLPDDRGGGIVWLMRRSRDRYEFLRCAGAPEAAESTAFFAALWELLADAADQPRLGRADTEVSEAAARSLHLGLLTQTGPRPRYGVGRYDQRRHDGFPPTTISTAEALLAVGRPQQALRHLQYYIYRYIQRDGSFDYYGPSVAEYGQILSVTALAAQQTGAARFFGEHAALLEPVWRRLLDMRQQSLEDHPSGDPRHGLIPGLPEADYHADDGEWHEFYYSGDLWACRGLMDMAAALSTVQQAWAHRQAQMLKEAAEQYRRDILNSISAVTEGGFVPPGPMQTEPLENLIPQRHPSYCNYRFYPEMLSAGTLPEDFAEAVIQWRRDHGGQILGTTRFTDHLDDWPVMHYARGLLQLGLVEEYLLVLYGHLAHHHDPGTLVSYEQVSIETENGARVPTAGQVVPCQMTVPTLLGWAMAYRHRDSDTIALLPAVPAHWLDEPGRLQGPPLFIRDGNCIRWSVTVEPGGATIEAESEVCGPVEVIIHTRGKSVGEARMEHQQGTVEPDVENGTVRTSIPYGLSAMRMRWK